MGIAVDSDGNLFVADFVNGRIRKISPTGIITTVAQVGSPSGVAVDSAGVLYFFDGDSQICRVSRDGIINTIAGTSFGYSGDGGPAAVAQLGAGWGLSVDRSGNIYVGDWVNNTVRLLQPIGSSLNVTSITNAASNLSGSISPGEIVVLYGSLLGPAALTQFHVNSAGNIDTQLAGTSVTFNGTPAPMIYTSSTQLAAIIPYEVSGTSAQVVVTYQGQVSTSATVQLASSAPGLFTLDSSGKGQLAAINQDGSINGPGHPAPVGSVVSLFATGEGQTSPGGVDGQPAHSSSTTPNRAGYYDNRRPSCYAAGMRVVHPGKWRGLMQINVQIPRNLPSGNSMPVVVSVGGVPSQAGVTLTVNGN